MANAILQPTPDGPCSSSCDSAHPSSGNSRERFRQANRAQVEEIIRHRTILAQQTGRAISLDDAARDWIARFAAHWRAEFDGASLAYCD